MSERLSDLWARFRTGEDPRLGLVAIAVLAAVAVAIWFRPGGPEFNVAGAASGTANSSTSGTTAEEVVTTTAPATAPPAVLVVHVAGAVTHPGLQRLAGGSRVADAIAAAGGTTPGADPDRLNLAAHLLDGQRVAVPRRGESPPSEVSPTGGTGAATATATGTLSLNAATATELDALPGVGPATARAIVEERARRGGFRSVRDLLSVPGIGDRRFAELKDRVRL